MHPKLKTWPTSIDELWGERGERNRKDAMDGKGENEILITMEKVHTFSHSIDWLAFITHDTHQPSNVGGISQTESEMEILSILT